MRIESPVAPFQPGAARALRRTRGSTGDFALPEMEGDAGAAAGNVAPPGLSGATCLLAEPAGSSGAAGATQAMQEARGDSHDRADRQALAEKAAEGQGRALLGALAGLQLAALGGGGAKMRQTLSDLAHALPQANDPRMDPRLKEVLSAIAQRAAIELARGG